jgi:adenylosuccinate lyase
MKEIFSESARLQKLLEVEAAVAQALAKLGTIPQAAAAEIRRKALSGEVKLERVKAIEREIKHDLMAVVKALSERCEGDAGKYVHLGVTSYDIVDTANALQLRDALKLIDEGLQDLQQAIAELAKVHAGAIMLGRTHGQAAAPITFGLKLAVYLMELQRHRERLAECKRRVCTGKMTGAVGTGAALAALGIDPLELQELVLREELGLEAELAASQIVQRDRYIEFIALLANIVTTIEKLAIELRNLQRSELAEVTERFDPEKQVGSSTMAHKRNPILCENICSLARIVRSMVVPTYENALLWHERDLTNSAAERFTLPHTCILTDDIIHKMIKVLRELGVFPEVMKANLARQGGFVLSEAVIMALVKRGMGRQEAYEEVRRAALAAFEKNLTFQQTLLERPIIAKLLSKAELDALLVPENYVGAAAQIVERAVALVERG